jgi:acyl carrier protein
LNERAQQIEQQLEKLLADHLEGSADLGSDTHLVRDLGLESVQVMEYVVDIEDHFDVSIDLKSLADVHTLGDMTAAVIRAMD